jgi:hypothetical protein
MERLLYISTARQPLGAQELDLILRNARHRNAAANVTGILVAGGRRFLQLLEGPADAVSALFERIERDPRHFAVVKLSHSTIDRRQTHDWSMAYHDLNAGLTLPEIVDRLIAEIDDPSLAAEFGQFARRHAA